MNTAGTVLDDDQRGETTGQHRVHMDEVGCEDAAGLRGQELLPGRANPAGRGIDAGIMQDLPDRGRRDRWPSLTSPPCTRRCPQVGLSVAMRITSLRIAAVVDGRPGRRLPA